MRVMRAHRYLALPTHMIYCLFAISILLQFCAVAFAQAKTVPKALLILPFDAPTNDVQHQPLSQGIPDLLMAYLAPYSEHMFLVDREHFHALVKESGLNFQGFLKEKNLGQVGELVQAHFILRGSFVIQSKQISIQAFLVQTENTQLLKSFEQKGSIHDLVKLCQALSKDIGAYFSAPLKSLPPLERDEDPKRNVRLIYGLGYYFNGQFHKAFPEFMKILKENPKDAEARFWLAKSFLEAGLKDHAQMEFQRFQKDFPVHGKMVEVRKIFEQEKWQ